MIKNKKTDSTVKLKAYAKLNLYLSITGIREDGYHLIDSVFAPISLYDEITMKKNADGINLTCDKEIPLDERNTAYKAAKLFFGQYKTGGVDITIKKNIPDMAGLGGGSSDAAAVLKGMCELYGVNYDEDALMEIGVKIGADVPFFVKGHTARVRGIGEEVTPIEMAKQINIALIKPDCALSTVEVYKKFDEQKQTSTNTCKDMEQALIDGNLKQISKAMNNDLEQAAFKMCPKVYEAKAYLLNSGAMSALMTGSGSCAFGLFEDENKAREAVNGYIGDGKAFFVKTKLTTNEIL